jgi:hypothetical protein
LVEGCCVTIEENENDVVAIALVASIVAVGLVVAITIVVVPLATITSQNFFPCKNHPQLDLLNNIDS